MNPSPPTEIEYDIDPTAIMGVSDVMKIDSKSTAFVDMLPKGEKGSSPTRSACCCCEDKKWCNKFDEHQAVHTKRLFNIEPPKKPQRLRSIGTLTAELFEEGSAPQGALKLAPLKLSPLTVPSRLQQSIAASTNSHFSALGNLPLSSPPSMPLRVQSVTATKSHPSCASHVIHITSNHGSSPPSMPRRRISLVKALAI
jgi:hypothetical protein